MRDSVFLGLMLIIALSNLHGCFETRKISGEIALLAASIDRLTTVESAKYLSKSRLDYSLSIRGRCSKIDHEVTNMYFSVSNMDKMWEEK